MKQKINRTKHSRRIITVALLFLTAILLASCAVENKALEDDSLTLVCFSVEDRSLSWSETVETTDYNDCVWYYTAEKHDNGDKVGETEEQIKVGNTGDLTEEIGPFSLGTWTFKLYGYSGADNESGVLEYVGTLEEVELTKTEKTLVQYLLLEFEATTEPTGTIIVSGDIYYTSCERKFYPNTVILKSTATGTEDLFVLEHSKALTLDNLSAGLYILTVQHRGVESGTEFTYAEGKLALNIKENSTITVGGTIEELLAYVTFNVTVKY